ncbi:AI-2E family transporter [Sporosalibacterium faouarense]|uniref:AI-2E family transporter n=1 Tax=Sporosalibacterium faouarense TaxID=516123 RepID=UPI00141D72F7|nr:AI-2E family transporter [Sporosalibacterium faouarense]MTI48974.1 AI-2E family transporter [Bacillota bacterium]
MDNIFFLTVLGYAKEIFLTCFIGLLIYYLIHIGNKYVLEDERFKITRKYIIWLVFIVLGLFLLYYIFRDSSDIKGLFMPVIYSIAFAYLLNPLVNILEDKGIKRLWGVLLIYLLLIGIIVVLAIIIFPRISLEFQKLGKNIDVYFEELIGYFNNLNELYLRYADNLKDLPPELQGIQEVIKNNLNKVQGSLVEGIQNFTTSIINMFSKILGLIIIPILTFYFLKDKDYFKKKIYLLIPKRFRPDTMKVGREIDTVLSKFIRGQIIVALFVGVFTVIGLAILGIDFALIIGLIAGIANFIPFFGPIIGTIPAVFFALLDRPIKAIWVIILFVVIQQIESNILSPKIVGESVGLHPVIVIVALLIGANIGGILGMLLAVPVAAIIRILSGFIIEKVTNI